MKHDGKMNVGMLLIAIVVIAGIWGVDLSGVYATLTSETAQDYYQRLAAAIIIIVVSFVSLGVRPGMIVAHTVKGKGVSFMEDVVLWHGVAPQGKEALQAKKELQRGR